MASLLPGLLLVLAIWGAVLVARHMLQSSVRELLGASFVGQRVVLDGKEVISDDLQILYRWPAMAMRDGLGGFTMLSAQWLCRARDGSYLLAMATGSSKLGDGSVHWSWRQLTGEQARASLRSKRKTYQAVFGQPSAN
ncbi:hypothetical protein [Dyella flagellata]|uniref:hypothetical protein n=1 Tax=Dyella flagellata TaxID=1867833 RepID=UPI0024E12496|nr:hypothetical protein [Dyella flagellata]